MELLVEDNEDDVALFKRAFAMRGIFNPNVEAISTRVHLLVVWTPGHQSTDPDAVRAWYKQVGTGRNA
jgi:hypothetical protein